MIKLRDANGNIIHLPTLRGVDGKSAYQYAVDGGFTGTEEEFINLLNNSSTIINNHMTDTTAHSDIREASTITIDTSSTTEGAVKSYTIKQGGNTITTIDIPKDMVVEDGSVVINPEGQDEGTYIKLVLANVSDPLYINVGTLVDIYTAKAEATQIQISIDSSTREISATIVAGSVGTAELTDSAVTTVKIKDANVTLEKLSTDIQASLKKADSAVQKVETGAENGTVAVDGTDVAVKGLGSAAYTNSDAYDAAGAASAVDNKLTEEVTRAKAAEEQALKDAKGYTDEVVNSLPDLNWDNIENKPTKLSEFENDVPYAKQSEILTKLSELEQDVELDNIFVAEYNTTSYEDVVAALYSKKEVIVKVPSDVFGEDFQYKEVFGRISCIDEDSEYTDIQFKAFVGDLKLNIKVTRNPLNEEWTEFETIWEYSKVNEIIPMESGEGVNTLQQVPETETWTTTNAKVKEYIDNNVGTADDETQKIRSEGYDIQVGAYGKSSIMTGAKSQNVGKKSHTEGSKNIAFESNAHAEGNETFAAGKHSHAEGNKSSAIGNASHAEGSSTIAQGEASHAEGGETQAIGNRSHAEGSLSVASADASHAEGEETQAAGYTSHAEGKSTVSQGYASHAEGRNTQALADDSHAEGKETQTQGVSSHAEGYKTISQGENSHAEGEETVAEGKASHTEGQNTISQGVNSHAEGKDTQAMADNSHAEGMSTIAQGQAAHAEGYQTIASGVYAHAEGGETHAVGDNSHAEGSNTFANNTNSHAEGVYTYARGLASHAEGFTTQANGNYSHTEGSDTISRGDNSHAEGDATVANGDNSHVEGSYTSTSNDANNAHAEGYLSKANGINSHAEGNNTTASGPNSHAEGYHTESSGDHSHAEGDQTKASGYSSHAEGTGTVASGDNQHVQGRYNDEDASSRYAHIIGNGTAAAPSNAHTVDWNGNAEYAGDVKANGCGGVNPISLVDTNKLASDAYKHAITNKGIKVESGLYKITTNDEGHITEVTPATKDDLISLGVADTDYVDQKVNEVRDFMILRDASTGVEYTVRINNGSFELSGNADPYIVIKTLPNKTDYTDTELFDPTGMVVEYYTPDLTSYEITDYTYDEYVTTGSDHHVITYTDSYNNVVTANVPITTRTLEEALADFNYTANSDGTYTITGWKGTYNGVASTEIIYPNSPLILV